MSPASTRCNVKTSREGFLRHAELFSVSAYIVQCQANQSLFLLQSRVVTKLHREFGLCLLRWLMAVSATYISVPVKGCHDLFRSHVGALKMSSYWNSYSLKEKFLLFCHGTFTTINWRFSFTFILPIQQVAWWLRNCDEDYKPCVFMTPNAVALWGMAIYLKSSHIFASRCVLKTVIITFFSVTHTILPLTKYTTWVTRKEINIVSIFAVGSALNTERCEQ